MKTPSTSSDAGGVFSFWEALAALARERHGRI
jgi:hypothetical protein